jgi:hypothetical protein
VSDIKLSRRLKLLSDELRALELSHASRTISLDVMLDMHNELTSWACDTSYTEAAQQVMAIIEKYCLTRELFRS